MDQQPLFTEDRVVLANGVAGQTVHVESGNPEIDAAHIGALGCSRGCAAVLQ